MREGNVYILDVNLDDMSKMRKLALGIFACVTKITVRVQTISRKGNQTSVDDPVKFRGF